VVPAIDPHCLNRSSPAKFWIQINYIHARAISVPTPDLIMTNLVVETSGRIRHSNVCCRDHG
jgi:hypothetical protein